MAGYTPLFNSIITSSIWSEDNDTRIVWITLLALADKDGIVEGSIAGLAPVARLSIESCQKAIDNLKKPDPYSRTKSYEGRRIMEINGGWRVLNLKRFREKAKSRAEYYRNWRAQKKETFPHTPLKKETNINSYSNSNSETAHNSETVAQQLQCNGREKKRVRKEKKFIPPTLEQITEYIKTNDYNVDPKKFFDYFTVSDWVDSKGKRVRNWKQKVITWSGTRGSDGAKNGKTHHQQYRRDFEAESKFGSVIEV